APCGLQSHAGFIDADPRSWVAATRRGPSMLSQRSQPRLSTVDTLSMVLAMNACTGTYGNYGSGRRRGGSQQPGRGNAGQACGGLESYAKVLALALGRVRVAVTGLVPGACHEIERLIGRKRGRVDR